MRLQIKMINYRERFRAVLLQYGLIKSYHNIFNILSGYIRTVNKNAIMIVNVESHIFSIDIEKCLKHHVSRPLETVYKS
jgi:hypothetical protein